MLAPFDLLVRNGLVYDGTGAPPREGDVLVGGGCIRAVGKSLVASATGDVDVIDARGLAVAPGFIDIHSHSDLTVLKNPRLESKVRQGVTTEIIGNCGLSPAPVVPGQEESLFAYLINTVRIDEAEKAGWTWPTMAAFVADVVGRGVACNLGALVGHGTLRVGVMGFAARPATDDESGAMVHMLERELDEGALGMSTGLAYPPNSFAESRENTTLCEVLARRQGLYAVHMRDEGDGLEASLGEVLGITRATGVNLEISHFKAAGPGSQARLDQALAVVGAARSEGLAVTCDQYPYTAYGSNLIDCLPPWLVARGAHRFLPALGHADVRRKVVTEMGAARRAWRGPADEASWDGILIASLKTERNRAYLGKSVRELARAWGLPEEEAVVRLVCEEDANVKIICFAMAEADVRRIMAESWVMVGSDGRAVAPYGEFAATHPHPRYYGTFPRVLGKYARDERVIPLESAIAKMTAMPAAKLGLKRRGRVHDGFHADIVVFDPGEVRDLATFENPHAYPVGVRHVLVNGIPVVRDGEHTGRLPGRFVKKGED